MSYINKIKKGNTEYDVQDTRVPSVSASDSGKYLGIDAEGHIVAKDMPAYYIEVGYYLADCTYTYEGYMDVPNPDYNPDDEDPNNDEEYISEYVTMTIGVADTSNLRNMLSTFENNGCELWKRKVSVDSTTGKYLIDWQEATANDFEVVQLIGNGAVIEAVNDELVAAFLQLNPNLPVATLAMLGITCIKITHITGVTCTKHWDFGEGTVTNYINANLQLGVFDLTGFGNELSAKMENTSFTFETGD